MSTATTRQRTAETAPSREEESRLSVKQLAIASAAAAAAAIVTSFFWKKGTLIATALTPAIVAVVSELLHRQSNRIAERVTVSTPSLGGALPAAFGGRGGGARADARSPSEGSSAEPDEPLPDAAGPAPPPAEGPASAPPPSAPVPAGRRRRSTAVRVFRAPKFRTKLVLATTAIAFVVAVAVLTLPELIAGQSVGASDRGTTLFGGNRGGGDDERDAGDGDQPAPSQDSQPQDGGGQTPPADGSSQQPREQPQDSDQPQQPSKEPQGSDGEEPQGEPPGSEPTPRTQP